MVDEARPLLRGKRRFCARRVVGLVTAVVGASAVVAVAARRRPGAGAEVEEEALEAEVLKAQPSARAAAGAGAEVDEEALEADVIKTQPSARAAATRAYVDDMCAATGGDFNWAACSDYERAALGGYCGGSGGYEGCLFDADAARYGDAVDSCAAAWGADGFYWYDVCKWQAVAALPELCAGTFTPSRPDMAAAAAPDPPAVAIDGVTADVLALCPAYAGLPETCSYCQSHAYCASCEGNAYCAAFLLKNPAVVGRGYGANIPDVFGQLDFWCDPATLAAVEADDFAALMS